MRAKREKAERTASTCEGGACAGCETASPCLKLNNWPVQLKLTPVQSPVFQDADLLLAADCTAFAYARFHQDFVGDRVMLIACPKLDQTDYSLKLAEILRSNDIRRMTLLRMQVPCCGGLEFAARRAMEISGKFIPLRVVVIAPDGSIVRDN